MQRFVFFAVAVLAAVQFVVPSARANILDDNNINLHIELTGPQAASYSSSFDPGSLAGGVPPQLGVSVDLFDAAGIGGTSAFPVFANADAAAGQYFLTAGVFNLAGFVVNNIAGTITFTDIDWGSDPGVVASVDILGIAGPLGNTSILTTSLSNLSIIDNGTGVSVDFSDVSLNPNDVLAFSFSLVPRHNLPEPGTLAVFGAGLLGLAITRRRMRR